MVQQVPEVLASAYTSPRFTQGDCWIDQIMVTQQHGSWHVSAFLDMEVASAGDCLSDLVSLCEGLAQMLPSTLRWWEPLFESYGQEPDFAGFRLRLLGGWYPYKAHIWPGIGENGFTHLLLAKDWETLFSQQKRSSPARSRDACHRCMERLVRPRQAMASIAATGWRGPY